MKQIYNKKRFQQANNMKALQWGGIAGTDIDFGLEINNKYLILGEWKTKGTDITLGQSLLGKRITDVWNESATKEAVFIYATHDSKPDDVVSEEDLTIEWVYKGGETITRHKGWSVRRFIEAFATLHGIKKITKHLTTK